MFDISSAKEFDSESAQEVSDFDINSAVEFDVESAVEVEAEPSVLPLPDITPADRPATPKNFEARMQDASKFLPQPDGSIATHKMAWENMGNSAIAFPTIVERNGKLEELSPDEAYSYALKTGEYKTFPSAKEAETYAAGSWKQGTPFDAPVETSPDAMRTIAKTKEIGAVPGQAKGGSQFFPRTSQERLDVGMPNALDQVREDMKFRVKDAWAEGDKQAIKSEAVYAIMANGGGKEDIEEWVKNNPEYVPSGVEDPDDSFLDKVVSGTVTMLPMLGRGIKAGQQAGLAGAATGALVGFAGGATSPITVPAGAAAGYAIGSGTGSTDYWRRQGSAEVFEMMLDEGVNKDIASKVAIVAGLPYAFLERLQVSKYIKGLPEPIKKSMKNLLLRNVTKALAAHGKNIAEETLTEGLQQAVATTASEIGKNIDNNVTDPNLLESAKKVVSATGKEMIAVLPAMVGMTLPGGIRSINQTVQQTNQQNNIQQSIKEFNQNNTWATAELVNGEIKLSPKSNLSPDVQKAPDIIEPLPPAPPPAGIPLEVLDANGVPVPKGIPLEVTDGQAQSGATLTDVNVDKKAKKADNLPGFDTKPAQTGVKVAQGQTLKELGIADYQSLPEEVQKEIWPLLSTDERKRILTTEEGASQEQTPDTKTVDAPEPTPQNEVPSPVAEVQQSDEKAKVTRADIIKKINAEQTAANRFENVTEEDVQKLLEEANKPADLPGVETVTESVTEQAPVVEQTGEIANRKLENGKAVRAEDGEPSMLQSNGNAVSLSRPMTPSAANNDILKNVFDLVGDNSADKYSVEKPAIINPTTGEIISKGTLRTGNDVKPAVKKRELQKQEVATPKTELVGKADELKPDITEQVTVQPVAAPTPAQADAGNYKKAHIKLDGLDIAIENPAGSIRKSKNPDNPWETEMKDHYGYIKRSTGADGDHVDTFINPDDNARTNNIFIVDQVDPKTGKFDEHKVMIGYDSKEQATKAYQQNYAPDWKGLGAINEIKPDSFKGWLKIGKKDKPFGKVAAPSPIEKAAESAGMASTLKAGIESGRVVIAKPTSDKVAEKEPANKPSKDILSNTILKIMNRDRKDGKMSFGKDTSDRIAERMMDAVENKLYGELTGTLHLGNPASRAAFEQLTGVKLPKTEGGTKEAIRKFVGEDVYEKHIADKKAAAEANEKKFKEEAKKRVNAELEKQRVNYNGKILSFAKFVEALIENGYTNVETNKKGAIPSYRITKPDGSWVRIKNKNEAQYIEDKLDAAKTTKEPTQTVAQETKKDYTSEEKAKEAEDGRDSTVPDKATEADTGNVEDTESTVSEEPGKGLPLANDEDRAASQGTTEQYDSTGILRAGNTGSVEQYNGATEGTGIDGGAGGRVVDPDDHVTGAASAIVPESSNFQITADDKIGIGTPVQKYDANIKAIRLLKELQKENRLATKEEQATLAKFTGWGWAQHLFKPAEKLKKDAPWMRRQQELQSLITPEEFKDARASTINAHYTSPLVAQAMWDKLSQMGFTAGRFLEPGCGIGNFLGLCPSSSNITAMGIEKDSITGQLAKYIYPKFDIVNKAMENVPFEREMFSAVAGNVPFADIAIFDENAKQYFGQKIKPNLHDFIILKSLYALQDGGVLSVITSAGTMDKQSTNVREMMAAKADFIGAVRLPSNAFEGNAGTSVVTDIVYMQKRAEGKEPSALTKTFIETGVAKINDKDIPINKYYLENPNQVVGKFDLGGLYSKDQMTVIYSGTDFSSDLQRALSGIPNGVYSQATIDRSIALTQSLAEINVPKESINDLIGEDADSIPPDVYTIGKDGKIYSKNDVGKWEEFDTRERITENMLKKDPTLIEQGYELGMISPAGEKGAKFYRADSTVRKIKGLIKLRNQRITLLKLESDIKATDKEIEQARKKLNEIYDNFVKEENPVNHRDNVNAIEDDRYAGLIWGLESDYQKGEGAGDKGKAIKADIFRKRINQPFKKIEKAGTAEEGLLIALSETGTPDLGRVAELTGRTIDNVADDLVKSGALFKSPVESEGTNKYELADIYLSGNVRLKLEQAKSATALSPEFMGNVAALEAVQPKWLTLDDNVYLPIGSPVIPEDTVIRFIANQLGISTERVSEYVTKNTEDNSWKINEKQMRLSQEAFKNNDEVWGTPDISFLDLMNLALNSKQAGIVVKETVRDGSGNRVSVINEAKTEQAKAKLKANEKAFVDFLKDNKDDGDVVVRNYNMQVNNQVIYVPKAPTSLTFPGLAATRTPREHQRNAIWRIVQGAINKTNTLLAHVVGAGKAQPLTAKVLTPNGFVEMGSLVVGSKVISVGGNEANVTGIYPQGEKDIYKVTFSDGSSTECCKEHLWETKTYRERSFAQRSKKLNKTWNCGSGKVRDLEEISKTLIAPHLSAKNHSIPIVSPISFPQRILPLDPYLLGVILGDGSIAHDAVGISSVDTEIIDRCRSVLPFNTQIKEPRQTKGCPTYHISMIKRHGFGKDIQKNPVVSALAGLNLMGKKSAAKFIPTMYKLSSIDDRIKLLRGLMDTDGTISKRNSLSYDTVSPQLAEDFIFIVRSLGGVCTLVVKEKHFTHNGERRKGQPCYHICFTLPNSIVPFSLSRKIERIKPKSEYLPARYVVSVEPIGKKQAQCIMVDDESHLYVTDDFIVTHNTIEMLAGVMELKRLGLRKKAMMVVPNHLSQQTAREIALAYPGARVLLATETNMNKKSRARFLGRVQTGDWDFVVVRQSQFIKIPPSPEAQIKRADQLIAEMLETIADAGKDDKRSVKQMEKKIDRLQQKLKKLHAVKRDYTLFWEDMGIDLLVIDEADMYKNLFFSTNQKVLGLGSKDGTEKTEDLYIKIEDLRKKHGSGGVIFATGTPISNTVAEAYHMMKYLQPESLAEMGIKTFDDFSNMYATARTAFELNAAATGYKERTRLISFQNLPELVKQLKKVWDIKTAEDLEEAGILVRGRDLPYLDNNKPTSTTIKSNATLEHLKEWLGVMMANLKQPKPGEKGGENTLTILNNGIRAAVDVRLFHWSLPDYADSKINKLVDMVVKEYKETKKFSGTQQIFYNLTKEDNPFPFNPYRDIKEKLIDAGIPADEIAVITDAKNDDAKGELFRNMNRGNKRIIIGSVQKMGAGTNIQERATAQYWMDPPWRPRDIEQGIGRIVRQGNKMTGGKDNELVMQKLIPETGRKVKVHFLIQEGSAEAFKWQVLMEKAKAIKSVFRSKGDDTIRMLEEDDSGYAEAMVQSMGDPLMVQKFSKDREIVAAKAVAEGVRDEILNNRRAIKHTEQMLPKYEKLIAGAKVEADAAKPDLSLKEWNTENKTSYEKYEDLGKVVQANITLYAKNNKVDLINIGKIGSYTFDIEYSTAAKETVVSVKFQGKETAKLPALGLTSKSPQAVAGELFTYARGKAAERTLESLEKSKKTLVESARLAEKRLEKLDTAESDLAVEKVKSELADIDSRVAEAVERKTKLEGFFNTIKNSGEVPDAAISALITSKEITQAEADDLRLMIDKAANRPDLDILYAEAKRAKGRQSDGDDITTEQDEQDKEDGADDDAETVQDSYEYIDEAEREMFSKAVEGVKSYRDFTRLFVNINPDLVYINNNGAYRWTKQKKPKVVEVDGYRFYVADFAGASKIVEPITGIGMVTVEGKTAKKQAEEAKAFFKKYPLNTKVLEAVKARIKDYGISPVYVLKNRVNQSIRFAHSDAAKMEATPTAEAMSVFAQEFAKISKGLTPEQINKVTVVFLPKSDTENNFMSISRPGDGSVELLVYKNLPSGREGITKDIQHEIIGHFGFWQLLNDRPDLRNKATFFYKADKSNNGKVYQNLRERYKKEMDLEGEVDEWIALNIEQYMAKKETTPFYKRVFEAIRDIIRAALKKVGITSSEENIDDIMKMIYKKVQSGKNVYGKNEVAVVDKTGGDNDVRRSVRWNKKKPADFSESVLDMAKSGEAAADGKTTRPAPNGKLPAFEDTETEKRFNAAKGFKGVPVKDKVNALIEELKQETRHFRFLPRGGRFGDIADILRVYESSKGGNKYSAMMAMNGFTANLTPQNFEAFTRTLILKDLSRDVRSGLYDEVDENGLKVTRDLPFGFTPKSLEQSLKDITEYNAQNPTVEEALEKRNQFMQDMRIELVSSGLLNEDVLKEDAGDYFHHIVLEKLAEKEVWGGGLSQSGMDVRKKGWQRARKGSEKDFNTAYLEAEGEVLASGLQQLELVNVLSQIKQRTDVKKDLEKTADKMNKAKVQELLATNPLEDVFSPYKKKIAIAIGQIENLAENGAFDDNPVFKSHSKAIDELITSAKTKKIDDEAGKSADMESGNLFKFLGLLANMSDSQDGVMQARSIFKAVADRKKLIKNTLNDKIVTWQDLIPKGYVAWQPEKGAHFYPVLSPLDALYEKLKKTGVEMDPELQKFLTPADKRMLVRGAKFQEWVIPEELAATLNEFGKMQEGENRVVKGMEIALSKWKQWILLNPFSALRYNINNMSGDADIAIAYNPKLLNPKKMWEAVKDLKNLADGRSIEPDVLEARKLGVVDSGMTFNEIPDLSEATLFKYLIDPSEKSIPKKLIKGSVAWYEWTRKMSGIREGILRLVAYRHFKKELAAGKRVYAASDIGEIDAITDGNRKAAKLARELIGDYGNLSKGGQWLRKKLIPFWSWQEINAPRYYRLFKNAAAEGRSANAAKFRAVGIKGATTAVKAGMFVGAKAGTLYMMITLWNKIFFHDEEEELSELQRRQVHLILGRREDGSIRMIRFQGALSDALSWINLDELPADIKEVMDEKRDISEIPKGMVTSPINRIVRSLSPILKTPMELASGKTFFPDVFNRRPIRDRLEYAFGFIGMTIPYAWAAGKPVREGKTLEGVKNEVIGIVTGSKTVDPGEAAYNDIRAKGYNYLESVQAPYNSQPTERANAMYYYRRALVYKDDAAAKKFLRQYFELGGKVKGMQASIKNAAPLAMIPADHVAPFFKTLSKTEVGRARQAYKWWNDTFNKDVPLVRDIKAIIEENRRKE